MITTVSRRKSRFAQPPNYKMDGAQEEDSSFHSGLCQTAADQEAIMDLQRQLQEAEGRAAAAEAALAAERTRAAAERTRAAAAEAALTAERTRADSLELALMSAEARYAQLVALHPSIIERTMLKRLFATCSQQHKGLSPSPFYYN